MTTDREFIDLVIGRLQKGRVVFIHSPAMWAECTLPVQLAWSRPVPFTRDNLENVPPDQYGVYSFVLEPNFSGPPKSAYLLYVGKTEENRGFRRRYQDYLYEQYKGFARPVISRALDRWNGHISFYYAPIDQVNLIDGVESALLISCVPPYNDKFPGRFGKAIGAFRLETS
jgi:hypothetical protein